MSGQSSGIMSGLKQLTKMRCLQLSSLVIHELELQERIAQLVNETGTGRNAKLPLNVHQLAYHQRLIVGQFTDLRIVLSPLDTTKAITTNYHSSVSKGGTCGEYQNMIFFKKLLFKIH